MGDQTDKQKKIYLNWALILRPLKAVEVMIAGFVFEHHAREYGKMFPKSSRAVVRWVGEGDPPNLDGGFPELVW
jgi:hypothetical protein